jgi:hypothetical protein
VELTFQQIESLTTGPHPIKGNRKGTHAIALES